jgi:hypothetical protein
MPSALAWDVPMTIDLAERLNLSSLLGAEMKAPLGVLRMRPDGVVIFNGQDITSQVTAMCSGSLPNEINPQTMPIPSEADNLAPNSMGGVQEIAPPPGSMAPQSSADEMALPSTVAPSVTITQ